MTPITRRGTRCSCWASWPREPAASIISTNPNSPDPIGANPTRAEVGVPRQRHPASRSGPTLPTSPSTSGSWDARCSGSTARIRASRASCCRGRSIAGGDAFGGDHWADEYAAIRERQRPPGRAADRHRAHRRGAERDVGVRQDAPGVNYLIVLNAHTQDSIPIVTDTSVTAPPAPFETNAAASNTSSTLLEQAKAELQAGGAGVPFSLPSGLHRTSIRRPRSSRSTARCGRGSRCTGATSPGRSPP